MQTRRLSIGVLALLLLMAATAQAQSRYADISAMLNQSAIKPGTTAVVAAIVNVKPGYHAQSRTPLNEFLIPFDASITATDPITPGTPVFPPGQIKEYPQLGKISVYEGRVIVFLPVTVKPGTAAGDLQIKGSVYFQICDDTSCFAPERHEFTVNTRVAAADEAVTMTNPEIFASYKPGGGSQATAAGSDRPQDWSMLYAFGVATLAGLLFNIMPCVLPVLPLKAVGFYEASQQNRGRSVALGLAFSLGIISVFAILAMLVLVLRVISWGDLFSSPWFIWPLVAMLIVMSFGLLGGWNLSLPLGIYTFEPRHDTYTGNYFWGGFSAILATPCTAPLLPPLLLWAAANPAYIGVPAVIMVGVGMALPYLLLSAMPEVARKLPRVGPWSELFKQMMGFMLLAVAVYFGAGRLVAGTGFWWAIVAVIGVAAFYLVARSVQLTPNARPVGIAAALAVGMIGGSIWWTLRMTNEHAWETFSTEQFTELRTANKPVLVKFTANWCGTCQYIEGTVFQNDAVWKALKAADITPLKVDLTGANPSGRELLLKLNPSGGIPLTAIWRPGSDDPVQLSSIYTSEELLKIVREMR